MIWSDIWNKAGNALTVNAAAQCEILSDIETHMQRRYALCFAVLPKLTTIALAHRLRAQKSG